MDLRFLSVVQDEILAGEGSALIGIAASGDSAWFDEHESTLLALYPSNSGSVWRAMTDAGADPMTAAMSVLEHANDKGRQSLSAFVRYNGSLTAEVKTDVLDLLKSAETP